MKISDSQFKLYPIQIKFQTRVTLPDKNIAWEKPEI